LHTSVCRCDHCRTAAPQIFTFPYTTLFRSDYVDASQLEALKLGVSVAETGREEHARTLRREAVENAALLSMLTLSPGEEERMSRSEEHTSELQSRFDLVCRLLLEKKNKIHD